MPGSKTNIEQLTPNVCFVLDFRMKELLTCDGELDKGSCLHKFHGPKLRYGIAISIGNCDIVHVNGPFKQVGQATTAT